MVGESASLGAAMATCKRTSGAGSLARARTFERTASSRWPDLAMLPAARTPQARKVGSSCASKTFMEGFFERGPADKDPEGVHAVLLRAFTLENEGLEPV